MDSFGPFFFVQDKRSGEVKEVVESGKRRG